MCAFLVPNIPLPSSVKILINKKSKAHQPFLLPSPLGSFISLNLDPVQMRALFLPHAKASITGHNSINHALLSEDPQQDQ